jgi:hypothetical protein
MTRRVLCGLVLSSVMLAAVLACFLGLLQIANARNARKMRPPPFEQVKEGMSREEVVRTMGGPPGNYSGGLCQSMCRRGLGSCQRWLYDEGELLVRFDDADRATYVVVRPVWHLRPPPLTQRIRSWLGL